MSRSSEKGRRLGGREATTAQIEGAYALAVGMPDKQAPEGWTWRLLTDLARLESGHTPSRRKPEYWGGDVPWIGIRDATANHGRTLHSTNENTNELGIANSAARVLPADTVCLSRTASVGYVVVMGRPMATSQDFVNWVCGEQLDYRFLKYVLIAEGDALLRFASGSVHQTIYFPEVKAFHIAVPPLTEQRAIADLLGALDDKIELNRRMDETLAATTEAIFRDWFVDFGPVRRKLAGATDPVEIMGGLILDGDEAAEVASLMPMGFAAEDLPSGWTRAMLGDYFAVERGLSYKGEFLGDTGIPMLNLGCFLGAGQFSYDRVKRYVGEYRPRHTVTKGSLVIANTDITQNRVVIGSPHLVEDDLGSDALLFSHHVYAARPKKSGIEDWATFFFYHLLQPAFRERAEGFATGTTVLALPKDAVEQFEFVVPTQGLYERFLRIVSPMRAFQAAHRAENRTLAETRDYLLPRLMSGEVRVRDVFREIAA